MNRCLFRSPRLFALTILTWLLMLSVGPLLTPWHHHIDDIDDTSWMDDDHIRCRFDRF